MGHEKRLNRESLTKSPGRDAVTRDVKTYCLEELIAEMTAAFLGAKVGIIEDGHENTAAYLRGWLKALKAGDNRTWLIKAASEAQRAADYILGGTEQRDSAVATSSPSLATCRNEESG